MTADASSTAAPGGPHPAAFDAVLARTTARLLAAAVAVVGSVALLCAALAAWRLWLPAPVSWPAVAVCALLPVERGLALRLHFDARLFADLADARDGSASLPSLDEALARLGLRHPARHARPLDDRVRGARRLMSGHVATVLLQVALMGAALLAAPR